MEWEIFGIAVLALMFLAASARLGTSLRHGAESRRQAPPVVRPDEMGAYRFSAILGWIVIGIIIFCVIAAFVLYRH